MATLAIVPILTHAADQSLTWTSGTTPAALGTGGELAFTYTDGKVQTLSVTIAAGDTITLGGGTIDFAADAVVKLAGYGKFIVNNTLTGVNGLTVTNIADKSGVLNYKGQLPSNGYATVFPGCDLDDITVLYADNPHSGYSWSNSGQIHWPYVVQRFTENGVKMMTLQMQIQYPYASFSGYLTKCVKIELKQSGADVTAYTVKTAFQPAFELADAKALAAYLDRPLTVIEPDVFACPEAVANGPRRCYFCKRTLFTALWEQARAYGFDLLLDGSNASDDAGERPGMQALRELRVASPLRECGLTKADIRVLSREAGLFTWDKPSSSCLATRVAQDQPLTRDLLRRIEAGEMALMELGFSDFRLRVRGDDALLQVTADQMEQARDRWYEITKRLQPLFSGLSLDAQARKGSL